MTIPELVRAQSSPLAQLEIMQRADVHLLTGRYYAGQLTKRELAHLILEKKEKPL